MDKILVTYFSATGTTKDVAENIANVLKADLFEIEPEEEYTSEDLNWHNNKSRSSVEMNDKNFRPAIKQKSINIDNYDTILIGFPVWWYTAPTIINTFIESANFSGKTLIPFCTSGGTGMSGCEKDLRKTYPDYNWKQGKRLTGMEDKNFIENWIIN